MGTGTPPVRIHLLGALRVVDGDSPVRFAAPPKTLPLLAFLAVHRLNPTPREDVAYVLWPDVSEAEARANLRRHLHYLQGALPVRPEPWVLATRASVRWNPRAPCVLDIAEFETLSRTASTREEAVGLYRGDLLERLDEEWLLYERDRLRNLQLTNLELIVAESVERGDSRRALDFARNLLVLDPFREDVIRQAMTLRQALGESTGALAEYRAFAERLRRELGVDPMPVTRACFDAIAAQRAPEITVQRDRHPRVDVPSSFPMVGRAAPFESLRSLWSRATQGHGGLVFIGGEAGIGKTRLLQEFATHAERDDAIVSVGRTTLAEPARYQAIVEALRQTPLHSLELEPVWRSVLALLVPEMRTEHPELEPPAALQSENEQARLFEAIFRALAALAQYRPLLLALEDLHWCGPATTACLEFLMRRIERKRILIVGTYREEEIVGAHTLRALRRRATSDRAFSHLALNRLDIAAVEALVAAISGLDKQVPEVAEYLYLQSEGNPLFLGEVLRDAIEAGTIEPGDLRWNVLSLALPKVPRGVRSTILERLGRLSPEARTVAEIGAAIGPGFDVDLVRAVSGWPEARLLDATDELIARHILRDAGAGSRSEFAFSHHLVQATVYESSDDRNRIRRHRRIARELERVAGERTDELAAQIAAHFDRAEEPAAAAEFYKRAARAALAVAANDSAVELATRGLELAQEPNLRIDLHEALAEAARRKDDAPARRRNLSEMLSLAIEHDVDRACDAVAHSVGVPLARQRAAFSKDELAALQGRLSGAASPRLAGELQLLAAVIERAEARFGPMLAHASDAVTSFASCGSLRGEIRAWLFAADAYILQERVTEAARAIDRARALWNTIAEPSILTTILNLEWRAALYAEEWAREHAIASDLLRLYEATGDRAGLAAAYRMLGHSAIELYLAAEVGRHLSTSLAIYEELGKPTDYRSTLHTLCHHAILFGLPADALSYARRSEEFSRTINFQVGEVEGAHTVCITEFLFGDPTEARRAGERAVRLAKKVNRGYLIGITLTTLGTAELACGAIGAALEHLGEGVRLLRASGSAEYLHEDIGWLGIANLRSGDPDGARRIADEAVALVTARGKWLTRPHYPLWLAARIRRALGDADAAATLLLDAHRVLAEKVSLIDNDGARANHLRLPLHREIMAAFERDEWPTADVLVRPLMESATT
jgi:DNA-binding SARP family transcriptional activator